MPPSNAVVYSLGAVMLFHSRKERGDPSRVRGRQRRPLLHLREFGGQDGFYWIKRDDGESQSSRRRVETRHSAFYDAMIQHERASGLVCVHISCL